MTDIPDGLFFIVLGVVLVVFHKPVGSLVLRTNRKLYPKAGKAMEDLTPPSAMLYPAVAFVAFGIVLMIND